MIGGEYMNILQPHCTAQRQLRCSMIYKISNNLKNHFYLIINFKINTLCFAFGWWRIYEYITTADAD